MRSPLPIVLLIASLLVLLRQLHFGVEGAGEGEDGLFYAEVQLEAEVLEVMAESFSDCSLETLQVCLHTLDGGGKGGGDGEWLLRFALPDTGPRSFGMLERQGGWTVRGEL